MSEWLDLMLEEIERKKQEEKAAREESDRRREAPSVRTPAKPARRRKSQSR